MAGKSEKPENKDIHILVVDDEFTALNVNIKALYSLGYENTSAAKDGKSALDILDHANPPFDLVILDLNMPEIDGLEFIRQAKTGRYEGALIMVSGEDESLMESAFDMAAGSGINVLDAIPKPINMDYFKTLLLKVQPA